MSSPVFQVPLPGEVVVLRQRLGVVALRLVRTARTLVLLPVESITGEEQGRLWFANVRCKGGH